MSADAMLEGDLEKALSQLQDQVRSQPADAKHRIFLFQLLAVLGQWDRSLNQLKVAAELDDNNSLMAQAYREALRCEVLRAEIFAGKSSPLIFGEPEAWIAQLSEALKLTAEGKLAEAQELRDQAFDEAPATSGKIVVATAPPSEANPEAGEATEEQSFAWISDADTRIGPVIEAVVNGKLFWIPFQRIRRIDIEAPGDVRDIVWTSAHFEWTNGGTTVGFIPTRYVGSESNENNDIRLARNTQFDEPVEGLLVGSGQRMFATDDGEFAIMDVRRIELDVDETASEEPEADG